MNESPIPAIITLQREGDYVAAEVRSRAALEQSPDDTDLLLLLAMSLHFQNRLDQALPIYKRLTELAPQSPVHWSNYATALTEAARGDDAEPAWRRVTELDPKNPLARIQIGLLLLARRQYLAARDMLLDAFELDRESPPARIHAARACALAQDFRGAEALLKPWRQWLPLGDDRLQLELAKQLLLLGRAPDSHFLLTELVSRQPNDLDARVALAHVEERFNHLDEAERLLPGADAVTDNEALRREIANLRATLTSRRGDATAARAQLEHSAPVHAGDYAYHYELARLRDKTGDPTAAMQSLETAHDLHCAELRHASPEAFAATAPALPGDIRTVDAEQFRRWPHYRSPSSRDCPIFVVGFPRSGTTLLEQMLDAHPGLQSMDENPFFERLAGTLRAHDPRILDDLSVLRQYDCDELRKRYLLMVNERMPRRWDARIVDKNPLNMLWLPFIYRLFPAARFIFCLRHPCDTLLSCYTQNFRSVVLAAACENLPRLARAYVQAMRVWLDHVEIFKPRVLVSRYEDLVADTPAQAARIAQFLELDDAAPMLAFDKHARAKGYIATPSYSQVIEPINTRGLGRWQNYREWFEPVLPTLAPMLDHWDYPGAAA